MWIGEGLGLLGLGLGLGWDESGLEAGCFGSQCHQPLAVRQALTTASA